MTSPIPPEVTALIARLRDYASDSGLDPETRLEIAAALEAAYPTTTGAGIEHRAEAERLIELAPSIDHSDPGTVATAHALLYLAEQITEGKSR